MKILLANLYVTIIVMVICAPVKKVESQQYSNIDPNSIGITHESPTERIMTSGVAFCDINNDYLEDLVFAAENEIKLYQNKGNGEFLEISSLAELVPIQNSFRSVATGDINNDGLPDIIADGAFSATKIFLNNGDLTFSDISLSSNINIYNGSYNTNKKVSSIALGDVNLDGWLDIYLTTWANEVQVGNYDITGLPTAYTHTGEKDRLYINNGDLTFTEMSAAYGLVNNDGSGLSGIFSDYDNDGDVDILIANDFGKWDEPDKLFRNEYPNASFTDVSSSSGYDTAIEGMGTGVGDYDKDGDLDYYKTSFGQKVLMNNSGGIFSEVAVAAGVDDTYASTNPNITRTGWGAGFTDCNNDGNLDLILANGMIGSNIARFVSGIDGVEVYQPSLLFFNNGDGTFNEVTQQEGIVDTLFTRGISYGDINNDGFQDLIFTRAGGPRLVTEVPDTRPAIYQNNGNGNNWLKIELEGVVNNRDAIGTHINIYTSSGNWLHEINSGAQGHGGQHSRIAHFGLSILNQVDSIVVKWPGANSPDQVFTNINTNQFIHIKELDTQYNVVTCYNGIKDGQEDMVDCGGPICVTCDCSDEYLVKDNSIINFNQSQIRTYKQYVEIINDSELNINQDESAFYAGDYIYLEEGELNVSNNAASLLLDIEDCIVKDLDYYVSFGNDGHFDLDSIDNYSIARIWMEVLLESIRHDFARPTIHARNLFHSSALMYDLWHLYNSATNINGTTYMVNQNLNGFACPMNTAGLNLDVKDLPEAISYGMARILNHRFSSSPGLSISDQNIYGLFQHFGYDVNYSGTNYASGNPADIGNYVAQCLINYGLQDGSNEMNDYANEFYEPVNDSLVTNHPGNPNLTDPNRWQPLSLDVFIDQSGNEIPVNTPDFLSPEWGEVHPFAMDGSDKTTYTKEGNTYHVYFDPSAPPLTDPMNPAMTNEYVMGFMMVSVWGSHLDPNDPTTIDISPSSIGNNNTPWPATYYDQPGYYDFFNGNDYGTGHTMNPTTGQAYSPQVVKRGDYTRVLAEFWADGPDSETPPGHWFTILNYVSDHPLFAKKFEGTGNVVDDLEWDVKSYFTLGGTMHDAAIAAWSVKGYYDYLRPISAIRYMAEEGQAIHPDQ